MSTKTYVSVDVSVIPKEVLEDLDELKEPDQTYDELIRELIETYKKVQLGEMVREKKKGEFVEVDTDNW